MEILSFLMLLAFGQTTQTPGLPDQRVIVIDSNNPSPAAEACKPQAFVESGSSIISSLPQENLQLAIQKWEEKCEEWKKDLKKNNGNNLLIRDCGQINRRTEKIQLVNYFIIESKAEYKIKVGCD